MTWTSFHILIFLTCRINKLWKFLNQVEIVSSCKNSKIMSVDYHILISLRLISFKHKRAILNRYPFYLILERIQLFHLLLWKKYLIEMAEEYEWNCKWLWHSIKGLKRRTFLYSTASWQLNIVVEQIVGICPWTELISYIWRLWYVFDSFNSTVCRLDGLNL